MAVVDGQTRLFGVESMAGSTDKFMVIGGLRKSEERELDGSSDPVNIIRLWVTEAMTELEPILVLLQVSNF